ILTRVRGLPRTRRGPCFPRPVHRHGAGRGGHMEDAQVERPESPEGFEGLIGRHPSMQVIFEVIRRVAPTDATVLITGESGTGKELVAGALHRLSSRAEARFVPVHCG